MTEAEKQRNKRYMKKIKRIQFHLNLAETEQVKHIENLNQKAKQLFLKEFCENA